MVAKQKYNMYFRVGLDSSIFIHFLNFIKQMPAIHESTRIKKNDEEPRNQLPSKIEKEITMNHCRQRRIRMINENLKMQRNDSPMCDLCINELNKS